MEDAEQVSRGKERFGIIKFLHFSLTQPVKRIYKKK
jgi:hypothetical protein